MKLQKSILFFIMLVITIISVFGIPFTPKGDVNLQSRYNLLNIANITGNGDINIVANSNTVNINSENMSIGGVNVATVGDLVGGNVTVSSVRVIQNKEGSTVSTGDPMKFTGWNNGLNVVEAQLADNSATTNNADCVMLETVLNNGNGQCVQSGDITSMDTSMFTVGDNLYLDTDNFTITRPSNAVCIQKVGQVVRSHVSAGVMSVSGAGRCNDVSRDAVFQGVVNASKFYDLNANQFEIFTHLSNLTDDLGSRATDWSDLQNFNVYCSAGYAVSGINKSNTCIEVGEKWSDTVDSNIVPDGDVTRSLGGTSKRFLESHVASYIGSNFKHVGDLDNEIAFGTDNQEFKTSGVKRLDITDSGVQFGNANARITTIYDEDAMGSNSATALATQQSIKAYVDSSTGGGGTTYSAWKNDPTTGWIDVGININNSYINVTNSTGGTVVHFPEDGTDSFILNSQLGIGTSAPSTSLHILETSSAAIISIEADAGGTSLDAQIFIDADDDTKMVYKRDGNAMWQVNNDRGLGDQLRWINNAGTAAITLSQTGDAWFVGDVSALTYTDRTPFYDGDALTEIKKIKGSNGEINHSSLPEFTKANYQMPVYSEYYLNEETNEITKDVIRLETKAGRDIGASVTMNTRAIQQLIEKIEVLESELLKIKAFK